MNEQCFLVWLKFHSGFLPQRVGLGLQDDVLTWLVFFYLQRPLGRCCCIPQWRKHHLGRQRWRSRPLAALHHPEHLGPGKGGPWPLEVGVASGSAKMGTGSSLATSVWTGTWEITPCCAAGRWVLGATRLLSLVSAFLSQNPEVLQPSPTSDPVPSSFSLRSKSSSPQSLSLVGLEGSPDPLLPGHMSPGLQPPSLSPLGPIKIQPPP